MKCLVWVVYYAGLLNILYVNMHPLQPIWQFTTHIEESKTKEKLHYESLNATSFFSSI